MELFWLKQGRREKDPQACPVDKASATTSAPWEPGFLKTRRGGPRPSPLGTRGCLEQETGVIALSLCGDEGGTTVTVASAGRGG